MGGGGGEGTVGLLDHRQAERNKQTGRQADGLVGWPAGRLAGWRAGGLAGWRAGGLANGLSVRQMR
jgi:hypothetical protein